jgi:hypothetical protein
MSEQTTADPAPDEGWDWSIVEIFGHRRHVGRIREEERFGTKMLRIDVPKVEYETREITGFASHYYGGGSIFSITPTDAASAVEANRKHSPFRTALLPRPEPDEPTFSDNDQDEDETDDEHA